jgi:hypothetical protein
MRRVALVQNQSEMRHNAYSDAREFFNTLTDVPELGCGTTLFTADNIRTLASELELNRFDAVVLGSNALQDRAIHAAFGEPGLIEALDRHLARDRGLICFHQLNFARSDDPTLRFLPSSLGTVTARRLDVAHGDIAVAPGAEGHVALLYPYEIDIEELNAFVKDHSQLAGTYWHAWSQFDAANWDVLVEDPRDDRLALLLVCRRAQVVLCAQPLDWQQHERLVLNLVVYATQGPPSTAVIRRDDRSDAGLDFIEGWLGGERFPYRTYHANRLDALRERVKSGVHTTVLLQPGLDLPDLEPDTKDVLVDGMLRSTLRVVGFGEPVEGVQRLWTAGEQFESITWLHWARALAIDELRNHGRTDGSFLATVETLEALEALGAIVPPAIPEDQLEQLANRVLERISDVTHDDSYDRTFAATCGLLRLRHGRDDTGAERTARWLRDRLGDKVGAHELPAYATFARLGRLRDDERARLAERLAENQKPKTELEALQLLDVALAADADESLPRLVHHVVEQKDDGGRWVDLSTTAGAIVSLLEARGRVDLEDERADFDAALLQATIYVRSAADEEQPFPWDNKASTSLRCLLALVRYNRTLDVPVIDAIEVVRRGDRFARQRAASDAAGAVLTDLRQSHEQLANQLKTTRQEARRARDLRVQRNRRSLILCVVAYLALFLLIGAATHDDPRTPASLHTLLNDTFGAYTELHLAMLALLGGVVVAMHDAFGIGPRAGPGDDASGDAA